MAKRDLLEKVKKEGGTLPPSRIAVSSTGAQTENRQGNSYFKLPENLGSRTAELEGAVITAQAGLQKQNTVLKTTQEKVQQIQNAILMAENGKLPMLNLQNMKRDLQVAQTALIIEQDKTNKAYDGYNSAVTSYNDYVSREKATYDGWRSTIRDDETIAADIANVQQRIQQLQAQYPALKTESRSSKWEEYMAIEKADQEIVDAARQLEALQEQKALLEEEQGWLSYFSYEDLRQAEDFVEKSKYVSTAPQAPTFWEKLTDTGEDPTYEYLNSEAYRQEYDRRERNYSQDKIIDDGDNYFESRGMDQIKKDEVAIYNYLYATQGKDAANKYLGYLQSDLNYRQRRTREEALTGFAKEHPGLASVMKIATSPFKGLSYIGQAVDYVTDGKIDENANYNKYSYQGTAIQKAVSEKIESNPKWGKVGSFAYNTGMSMAEFILNTAISGGNQALSLAIMGTGAAADTVIEAKDRGLEDGKAFLLGTIAGAAEVVTEKISIDALLDHTGMGKSAVGYILKNALAEGSEEAGSTIINTMADLLISKDKSQWLMSIEAYKKQGMDEGEAFTKAMADQAVALGLDILGGMISGGTLGGVSVAGSAIGAVRTGKQISEQNPDVAQVQDMVNFGLQADADSRANYLAQSFQQKLSRGEALSDYDLGRLAQANVQAIEQGMLNGVSVEQMLQRADDLAKNRSTVAQQTSAPQVATNQMSAQEQEAAAQRLSNLFGRKIELVSVAATEDGIRNGWTENGVLYVNTKSGDPFARIVGHELTHNTEHADVYNQISGTILRRVAASGTDLRQHRAQIKALYAANGEQLTDVQVDQEIVADYIGQYLFTDEASITELTKEKPSAGRRILQWLDQLLAKLGNADAQERAFLNRARNLYAKALQQTQSSFPEDGASASETLEWAREAYANGEMTEEEFDSYLDQIIEQEEMENAREPAEVKHSISPTFAAEIDAWDGRTDKTFFVGSTSNALKSIGVRDSGIIWHSAKLNKIMQKHGAMTKDIIKQVPEILEHPVAVLASKQSDSRLVMFGTVKDTNGDPVTAILELQPTSKGGQLLDMTVIASAYGKEGNVAKFVESSGLVYLDPDKQRTESWMQGLGLQLPSDATAFGSIGNISYPDGNVKIESVPYSQYMQSANDLNTEVDPMEQWEEERRLKLPTLETEEGGGQRRFSISPSAVAKQDVISELRGILQRGGDPAELRRYVGQLEGNAVKEGSRLPHQSADWFAMTSSDESAAEQSGGFAERSNENAYRNNIFSEQSGGFAERSNENAYRNNIFSEQSAGETEQILRSAKQQGVSVSQYLQENWERYEVDGQWSAAAQRALDQERSGRRRYSISASEATESDAPNLLKSYENVNLAEDSEVYSYQFLTSQPDMQIVTLPDVDSVRDSDGKINTAKVVEAGIKNALSVGTEKAGNIYVPNRYTGRELWVTASAIRHGLNGAFNRRLTNARIGSVIGEIVHNAIPINALHNTAESVVGTYAMIGYAKDSKGREFVAVVTVEQREDAVSSIDLYDVTHAISGRQKRNSQLELTASEGGTQADTESQGVNLIKDSSEISIAGLLDTVKNVYQSILSEDVLQNLGESRDQNGHYSGRVKFSISPNKEVGLRLPTLEEAEAENLRSLLPAKARNALQRIERDLIDGLGNSLSVPWLARREYLRGTVQQIADSYLCTGTVEQELINQLFEDAYQRGIVVDSEFYDAYKHIKKHLQTTPVTISAQDQADIADFHIFKTEANKYKTLRIVNEGGMPVDSYYRELQEMAPELFPERITHPADQLQRMYDVAKSIRISESSLKEYYGPEEEDFRQFAKHHFQEVVEETFQNLRNVKRFLEEAQEEAEKAPATEQEAAEAWVQLKESRKAYEKAIAKNLLTNHDEALVGDLLRGKISLEHLDPEMENVKGITAVYEAKKEYERWSKLLAEYKSQRRAELFRQADGDLETANDWKDKKAGILYSRETMTRNIEDIIPDKELAKKILREYIEPVAVAEAAATRFKEEYRGKVRELNLSRKVVKGNLVSEAHAVQLLGEAMDNIRVLERAGKRLRHRDGKTLDEWRGVVQDLWRENPKLDQKKIQDAVESFRKIYDELFQQMNAVRIRFGYEPVNYRQGYFPHFQPGDGDGILAHFGKVMGIDTSVTALPTTINGLTHTFKPGIQWFGNAQERLGFNTAYDAVEGFDKYIEGVASVIHQTENIQKLRALASRVRYRTSDEGLRKQVDAVLESDRLTEEEKQAQIAEIYSKGKFTLSNFVVELDEYTNILANKKSKLDRTVEAMMGRKIYTLMKWWEGRVGTNMIAGNLSSAMTNFIPLTQAGAQMGRGNLLRGMWGALRAIRKNDGFVNLSDFLTNRHGSDPLVQTWVQKGSNIAGKPMELIDSFVSESIVRGAYLQNRKQGLSEAEAMHQADLFAARVMADRSKGAMPTLFASSNPLFKAFTQFQLEVNNQFSEVFKDLPRGFKEKGLAVLAWVLLKYFLGAFLFNELFEYFFGRRPALDPLGIINDTVGDFTGYELPNLIELGGDLITGEEISFESRKVGVGTGVKNLASNVLEELPFSSGLTLLGIETDGGRLPASSAVPDLTALWDAATTEGWSGKKRLKEAWDELQKPLTYIVPPFGGNQVAKTWKGLAAYFRGGSYNVNKDGENFLQYPVFKDDPDDAFWNLVRTAIMGKSSLPEAQDWVESGFDSLGTQQTVAYQDMVDAGVNDREAYALIRQLEQTKKTDETTRSTEQRKVLRSSEISAEGKAVAYYGLIATDRERELMDRLTDAGADSGQTVQIVMDLQDLTGLKGQEKKTAQRDLLAKAPMTDDEKSVIVEDFLGSDLMTAEGNPTQYAKFLCATQTGLDVDGFMDLYAAGCDMDDYFGFTDAGLSSTEAKKITMELKDLKPEGGAEKVTNVQKWRAAADGAADKMGALAAVMSDDQYAKVEIANNFGVDPNAYITLQEIRTQYDADGNGSYTQAETKAAIDTMGVSIEQKAVLWQLSTGSTSAKNNPYSQTIGNKVLAAKQEQKAAAEEPKQETLSFSEEIMRQLTGG